MAKIVETVAVKVEADTKQAESNLDKLNNKTKMNTASFAKAGIAIAAVGAALGKAAQAAKETIELWTIQEKAIQKNESALAAWGRDVNNGSRRLQKFASEMQSATNIGDELILGLTGSAVAMGATAKEAEEATKAAIGLSEATGVGLNEALKAVLKAQQGELGSLQEYVPALRNVSNETEAWDLINKTAASGLDTLAESTGTLEGKTTRLSNAWGDFREQIGRVFALDPPGIIDKLSNALERATGNWQQNNDLQEFYNEQMEKGANLTGITVKEVLDWNAANERGAAILEHLNRQLEDTAEKVEDLNELWEPEKPRAYWEEYAENLQLQYGNLSELERLEMMRANAIRDTRTEYADLNAEIEEMINTYYDMERASIQAANIQEIQDGFMAWSLARQREHEEELRRIEAEKQARRNMIANMTAAYGNAFSQVGGFISTMYGIQAEGLEEGSKAQQRALRKQAVAEKANAVFSSLVNTAVAVVKALPNIPLSIASGIAGAAQTAAILATPLPSFATGTPPGGYKVPPGFEDDSYPVRAKSGETVHVEREGSAGQPQYIVNRIVIDGYEFGDVITRLAEDRKLSIPAEVVA